MLAVVCASVALAAPPVTGEAGAAPLRFEDAGEARRFQRLVSELRCVMCQNQSLADSDALIAHELRAEVLALMRQGRDDAAIKAHLVARYGEFVLYRPRVEPTTWLLWFGPAVVLLVGGFVVAGIVRKRSGKRQSAAAVDEDQEW